MYKYGDLLRVKSGTLHAHFNSTNGPFTFQNKHTHGAYIVVKPFNSQDEWCFLENEVEHAIRSKTKLEPSDV